MEPSLERVNLISRINRIQDVKALIPNNLKINTCALALIDFDDTLIHSGCPQAAFLGGIKWRKAVKIAIDSLKKKNITVFKPLFSYLTLFVTMSIKAEPVEASTITAIKTLKDAGFELKIFTARGLDCWNMETLKGIEHLTFKQMEEAGLSLLFKQKTGTLIGCSYKDKQKVLEELFEKKVIDPAQLSLLAYVDDRQDALPEISKLAEKYRFSFIGLYYTASEEKESLGFDLMKSTLHLINLFEKGRLLTLEEEKKEEANFNSSNISREQFFENVLLRINRFFLQFHKEASFKDAEDFFLMTSNAAKSNF
ncbi:MAG: DUF2608 domain-containing protein [Parachlamydiaceae bacterium]